MLSVYTLDNSIEWDNAVRSFSNYDVYYLSRYAKSFEIHGDGKPMLFYYEGDSIRAINAVMFRDISADKNFVGKIEEGRYFDLITPYGYGGWLIEGSGDRSKLFEAYEQYCKNHGVISEFVRFHPVLNNCNDVKDFYVTIFLGHTITINLHSQEDIWNNFTSKNRNTIRRAQKNGVVIKHGKLPYLYDKFIEMYNATMDRDNANEYYYFSPEFYRGYYSDFADNSELFYAENAQGDTIAASIILNANGKLSYHLSGSKIEYRSLAPTNLLLYTVALWGCENGYKSFHLGGGLGAKEDSLFDFKKSFYRGEPCDYYIGKKIFDKEAYDKLSAINGKQSDYFPMYRSK